MYFVQNPFGDDLAYVRVLFILIIATRLGNFFVFINTMSYL